MRIYPFAFRVNSSNLDPAFCWRRGAQLVALNWQNLDKGMMLNHGMFAGTAGWVLKPDGYRSSEPSSDLIQRRTLNLVLEVFAAQNLSLPPDESKEKGFKPYVNCQLHVEEPDGPVAAGQDDASSDSEKSSFRRCTKSSSGVNPDFKGQKLVFPTVTGAVEELSFVRFVPLLLRMISNHSSSNTPALLPIVYSLSCPETTLVLTPTLRFFLTPFPAFTYRCIVSVKCKWGHPYHADLSLHHFAFSPAHQKLPFLNQIPTVLFLQNLPARHFPSRPHLHRCLRNRRAAPFHFLHYTRETGEMHGSGCSFLC